MRLRAASTCSKYTRTYHYVCVVRGMEGCFYFGIKKEEAQGTRQYFSRGDTFRAPLTPLPVLMHQPHSPPDDETPLGGDTP